MADERDEENPFRLARIEKLKALRAMGIDPYPYGFTVTATAKELETR
jgi:lysyl-tRNA synthetase class II